MTVGVWWIGVYLGRDAVYPSPHGAGCCPEHTEPRRLFGGWCRYTGSLCTIVISSVEAVAPLSPDPVSAYSWSFPVDAVDGYVEACASVYVVADAGWVTAECYGYEFDWSFFNVAQYENVRLVCA